MISRADIDELVDDEIMIMRLILKEEPWLRSFKVTKTTTAKQCRATKDGTIIIPATYIYSNNGASLRREIRPILVDLITGFASRDKFRWQRIAKKVGLIFNISADDLCECKLCGKLTALLSSQRCHQCWEVEKAVQAAPDIARLVLERMN